VRRMRNLARKLGPLAALAMIALIGAGCSNASENGNASGGNNNATGRDKALKFAACMRENGVRDFPDPDASGELTIDGAVNGSSLDPRTAAFNQAMSACRDLQPSGFMGHERSAQEQAHALKFARCMRDNGIEDFPDPTLDGPLIDTTRMPGSPGARSIPGFGAAMEACRDIPPTAGVTRGQ
jgi:hypothetical protein